MSEVVDFYQQEAKQVHENVLAIMKQHGVDRLTKYGFPTRHDEDWKYSPPDAFLKERFTTATGHKSFSNKSTIDPRIFMSTFSEALKDHKELMEKYLPRIMIGDHGFHALNTAMFNTSFVIYVPKKVKVKEPITLSHFQTQPNKAGYARYLFILEEGAELSIIEEYKGKDKICYFTNVISEAFLHENANLTHMLIQCESKSAYHFSHFLAYQSTNSKLTSHAIHLGGQWVRSDKSCYLRGKNAAVTLNGLYAIKEQQHLDQHTLVSHEVGSCVSKQDYKGVVGDFAKAIFNGRVVVHKDAQKTQAEQQNKNLLISKSAEVNTKPQLEIEANDVMCTHGATVGQLNADALFYCLSRGIAKNDALQLLISGFLHSNLEAIADSELKKFLLLELNKTYENSEL